MNALNISLLPLVYVWYVPFKIVITEGKERERRAVFWERADNTESNKRRATLTWTQRFYHRSEHYRKCIA